MSDQQGATPASTTPGATPNPSESGDTAEDLAAQKLLADAVASQGDGDEPLRQEGINALRRERAAKEAAEKAAREALAKVQEYEDRDKTELQKATEAAAKAAKDAETARTEALRYRIAAKNGITDEDADLFLNGSDEATITAQAVRYAELAKASTTPPAPSGGPVVPKSGTGGGSAAGGTVSAGRDLFKSSRSTDREKETNHA